MDGGREGEREGGWIDCLGSDVGVDVDVDVGVPVHVFEYERTWMWRFPINPKRSCGWFPFDVEEWDGCWGDCEFAFEGESRGRGGFEKERHGFRSGCLCWLRRRGRTYL